ncbi:hypothetical protein QKC54_gp0645 [Megavirus baoshan]|uniref:Uncharacterized protein n=1 Tax=Megavirus baoshan TaxID=2496520 RepID=A0A3Q8U7Q6_9VIRU|nr:hypothetical protein QKC54_gp0645 [Megavirus baoshan]AZL89191.1 hypothetical protein Mb0427 [Megavirus baoshan]
MNRNLIQYIYSEQVKFFVANCKNRDNIVSKLNFQKISKEKYHFGIILNDTYLNPVFNEINTKLYSPIEIVEYYCLDIITRLSVGKDLYTYKFIFIDIKKLFNGEFNIEEFCVWCQKSIDDSFFLNKIFFVTDINPFFYKKINENNKNILKFLKFLEEISHHNCFIISTDNDLYANITIYQNSSNLVNTKLILAGNISQPNIPPYIFKTWSDYNFFDGHYIVRESSKLTGYTELFLSDYKFNLEYKCMNQKELNREIVHYIIRVIDKNINLDKQNLINLINYINDNNTIDNYLIDNQDKSIYKNHIRTRLITQIDYRLDLILNNIKI